MSDVLKDRDELLNAVKAPERKKKSPSNAALWATAIFANLVFLLLDVISGITVWWMTNFVLYGILTFLAGFAPLLLHEMGYVRAYASQFQKTISMIGAGVALLSIVIIAVVAGVINIQGADSVSMQTAEVGTIITLVVIASIHAILASIYFYADEGILTAQQTAQAVARAQNQQEKIKAAHEILMLIEKSVQARRNISDQRTEAAVKEIMAQLGEDRDGDGVPDILQRRPQVLAQYNQEAEVPNFSNNGNGKHHDPVNPTNPQR